MPQIILDIPNSEETVSGPIAYSIVTRVLKTLKFYKDDFNIIFLNNTPQATIKGSDIDTVLQDRSQNRLPTDAQVRIEVDERYNENMSRSTAIREKTEFNIFNCEKTKTTMHPGYQQMIATVNISFRFPNRHAAESFRRKMRLAAVRSVDGMNLEVKYSYIIPYQFLGLLEHIYTLMEKQHGYGIELGQWLKESFCGNLTTLANQSGGKSVLGINELNTNVLILLANPDEPERKEKENDEDAWTVNLQFDAYYDRPDVMRMAYQYVINNQLIDSKYMNMARIRTPDFENTRTYIGLHDAKKAGLTPRGRNPVNTYTSPMFDDWLPAFFIDDYSDMLRALVMVDTNQPTAVMDLRDIADWGLGESTLQYLLRHRTTITEKYINFFHIRLWEFDKLLSADKVILDENLMVHYLDGLDPRKNYHLVISMAFDPSKLKPDAWDDDVDFIKDYVETVRPEWVDTITDLVNNHQEKYPDTSEKPWFEIEHKPWKPTDPWEGNVTPPIITDLIEKMKDPIYVRKPDTILGGRKPYRMNTVMIHGIIFKREKD